MANGPVGKIRSVGITILLFIITFGIYYLVWVFKTYKEMKAHSGQGLGGGLGLLIAFIPIASIATYFLLPGEVGNLYAGEGQAAPVSAMTGFWVLLPLVGGIVWVVKTQGALNRFWESKGAVAA